MKTLKGIPEFTSQFLLSREYNAFLYWKEKQKCFILIQYISLNGNFENVNRKLKIILDYNAYKFVVDSLDEKTFVFKPYERTRRWPCIIFFDLIAYILQASWVIYCLKYPDLKIVQQKNRKEFLYRLRLYMVVPLMKKRKESADHKYFDHDIKILWIT